MQIKFNQRFERLDFQIERNNFIIYCKSKDDIQYYAPFPCYRERFWIQIFETLNYDVIGMQNVTKQILDFLEYNGVKNG